ncbi:MAG: hypothetical protein VYE77_04080 [Planctomycetota bacterium]|nr:hypothetical protein [Planctomycetota bacterium]
MTRPGSSPQRACRHELHPRRLGGHRRLLSGLLVGTALLGIPGACGDTPKEEPAVPVPEATADSPLLTVDGITVRFGDLEESLAYFDSLDPQGSKRTKMNRILEELVLPLKFAQRDFASERQELLNKAKALRSVADNVHELEAASEFEISRRKTVTPRDVEIPIAQFLFDPLKTGGVSQPIEVPQGYVLASAYDLEQVQLVLLDRCDALQVLFSNQDIAAYRQWKDDLFRRIADKVTYFHPDYRDAIPPWMQLP